MTRAATSRRTVRPGGEVAHRLLDSEASSAAVLIAAVVGACVWATASTGYERFWDTPLALSVGQHAVEHSLREWVNSGLMTLFFVVVGLEARREFDLGELRERRRVMAPIVTAVAAMAIPALLFLVVSAGTPDAAHGWGVAISTDTAFALGYLTLLARNGAERLRVFLLTVLVIDDLISVLVVSVGYSEDVVWWRLAVAVVLYALFALMLRAGVDRPAFYAVVGLLIWVAVFGSGIDPVIVGLAIGALASAYPPHRESLEQATRSFRVFREEPTPDSARIANVAVTATQSPNGRLRRVYLPWATFVIVPLFGLANAGIRLDGDTLHTAATSRITLGVVVAYLLGKPLGYLLSRYVLRAVAGARAPVPVAGFGLAAVGITAAAPFTLSLLIADRALDGDELVQVKAGILVALVAVLPVGAVVFRAIGRLAPVRRARALHGDGFVLNDLSEQVDDAVDHVRGAEDADVTIVEYGDFECPHCGQAAQTAHDELAEDAQVRYVWRHLPLSEVHPHARRAAEASEAAAAQGRFWPMQEVLLQHQDDLTDAALIDVATGLGLDVARFTADLESGTFRDRVERDLRSADASDVAGTPTFFVNGRRHYGGYDFASIREAVREARLRGMAADAAR